MDILCGNSMSRGCLGFGTTMDNDLSQRRSWGDEDSPRRRLSSMGLHPNASHVDLETEFNPFIPTSGSYEVHLEPETQGGRFNTPLSVGGCSGTGHYTPSPPTKRPSEDEATSPNKTRTCGTPSYTCGRGKRNKRLDNATDALHKYCAVNANLVDLCKSFGGGNSSATSTSDQSCTVKDCLKKVKELPGYNQDILFNAADLFDNAHVRSVFMALDDEDKLGWIAHRLR